jgi:enoyl-CoA hydratase/carnithine racemase
MEFADLIYETRGPVARIAINRPERLNALRMGISDRALIDAIAHTEANDDIKVVVLTGVGSKAFCTGWDLEAIEDTPLDQLEGLIRSNLELFFKVWHSPKPVVAAINGYAIGTGSALALACDLSLAADHARLGEPEIRHGALSPFLILPFLTHSKAVHEIYYTGDLVGADDLLRLGLVNRVVAADDLEDAAWAYAERLAKVPGFSLQLTKRSLRAAYDVMGLTTVVRQHGLADTIAIGSGFPEQKVLLDILVEQGMKAFLNARDGPFKTSE